MPYDREDSNKKIDKGLTYEFYGKINGRGYGYDKEEQPTTVNNNFRGLFCLWNGVEAEQADFRFGIATSANKTSLTGIIYNTGWKEVPSAFYRDGKYHNQKVYFSDYGKAEINYGDDFYLTVTIDGENYEQAVYINGNLLEYGDKKTKGFLAKEYWDDFITANVPTLNTFCLGRSSWNGHGWWYYSQSSVYVLRLYNRALTEDEVMENYTTSVAYRNTMVTE